MFYLHRDNDIFLYNHAPHYYKTTLILKTMRKTSAVFFCYVENMIVLSVIFLVALSVGSTSVRYSAKKIDSFDLLIGEWDTSVRFPRNIAQQFPWEEVFGSASSVKPRNQDSDRGICTFRLRLYQNGTFGMVPLYSADNAPAPMCIRGRWKLQTNPYCVTDRFYDNLYLESYPRVQKTLYQSDNGVVNSSDAVITQKLRLQLQCRLYGHFTARRLRFRDRHYYARGKLTHGVVRWENRKSGSMDSESSRWWKIIRTFRRPKIEASFSARRFLPCPRNVVSSTNEYNDVDFEY
jgi:hypothetical protein